MATQEVVGLYGSKQAATGNDDRHLVSLLTQIRDDARAHQRKMRLLWFVVLVACVLFFIFSALFFMDKLSTLFT